VEKLNEAQTAVDGIHKAAAAQEAAQAAAEALHPWPSDARLVPSTHPAYPSGPPQLLHSNVAKLGTYLFSLPGGISTPNHGGEHCMGQSTVSGSQDDLDDHPDSSHAADGEGEFRGRSVVGTGDKANEQQQGGEQLTGWQQRLQSGMTQQQLQQV